MWWAAWVAWLWVAWAVGVLGGVVAFCPPACRCNDQVPSAECVAARLTVLPILFNPRLKHLNLAHNMISSVAETLNFLEQLEELDLSHNRLSSLDKGHLERQQRLQKLRLAHNRLTKLSPGALKGLKRLSLLDLSHNGLSQIVPRVLEDTPSLTVLLLAHNNLHLLHHEAFQGLTTLRVLDLCHNHFTAVPASTLDSVPTLKSLHLCHNRITRLQSRAFITPALSSLLLEANMIEEVAEDAFTLSHHLKLLNLKDNLLRQVPVLPPTLTSLILSKNNMSSIGPEALATLGQLSSLEISRCPYLAQLHPAAFTHCLNLHHITLSHNPQLRHLPETLLSGLTHLVHLDLRANSLQSVSKTSLPLTNLQKLDLRHNPLVCNCSLRWLSALLDTTNTTMVVPDVKCAAPPWLKDHYLSRWDNNHCLLIPHPYHTTNSLQPHENKPQQHHCLTVIYTNPCA